MDFPGPHRVGKYGVNLENFHRVALPALEVRPGVDLIVVDEVGKMECLSARFVAAMERLWAAPVPLLVTVAEKGGGYIAAIKGKPDKIMVTVTPGNRDALPARILEFLKITAQADRPWPHFGDIDGFTVWWGKISVGDLRAYQRLAARDGRPTHKTKFHGWL